MRQHRPTARIAFAAAIATATILISTPSSPLTFLVGPPDEVVPKLQATLTPTDFPMVYQATVIVDVRRGFCEAGDPHWRGWIAELKETPPAGDFPHVCAESREQGVTQAGVAMETYLRQIIASVEPLYELDAIQSAVTNIYGFAAAPSDSGGNAQIIGSIAIPRMMRDPLFGLRYGPSKIRFDAAPPSIGEQCPTLRGRQLWIYGKWEEADRRFGSSPVSSLRIRRRSAITEASSRMPTASSSHCMGRNVDSTHRQRSYRLMLDEAPERNRSRFPRQREGALQSISCVATQLRSAGVRSCVKSSIRRASIGTTCRQSCARR